MRNTSRRDSVCVCICAYVCSFAADLSAVAHMPEEQ